MKTSYFAKYKGLDGVSIAMRTPSWFRCKKYPPLFPPWELITQYKKDGDKEAYVQAYHEQVLSQLSPQKVYDDLKDSVLLCYEKPGDFCHRRLVAEWLRACLGVVVEEVRYEP